MCCVRFLLFFSSSFGAVAADDVGCGYGDLSVLGDWECRAIRQLY